MPDVGIRLLVAAPPGRRRTVIGALEDAEDYKAFEATIIAGL